MARTDRRSFLLQAAAGLAAVAAAGLPARAQMRLRQQFDDGYGGIYQDAPAWRDPRMEPGDPSLDPYLEGGTPSRPLPPEALEPRLMYAAIDTEPFPVPAVKLSSIKPEFVRRTVDYAGPEEGGTVVIDPQAHHLYFVQGDGTAIRYGVGVGRQGFGWSGEATVHDKQRWPDWYPPKEMLDRQPELAAKMQQLQSGVGMPGGPGNPLGARAMYLWQGNKDTLFRMHGTTEPWTIGRSVSSGCIRMINQDAIDLYDRVGVGARVIVLGSRSRQRPGVARM
jgi:lipoprotein-anchoring transpeptidase ErfK/SrfK